jgi:hypothetical protein
VRHARGASTLHRWLHVGQVYPVVTRAVVRLKMPDWLAKVARPTRSYADAHNEFRAGSSQRLVLS